MLFKLSHPIFEFVSLALSPLQRQQTEALLKVTRCSTYHFFALGLRAFVRHLLVGSALLRLGKLWSKQAKLVSLSSSQSCSPEDSEQLITKLLLTRLAPSQVLAIQGAIRSSTPDTDARLVVLASRSSTTATTEPLSQPVPVLIAQLASTFRFPVAAADTAYT
jgi:hypothetical protein